MEEKESFPDKLGLSRDIFKSLGEQEDEESLKGCSRRNFLKGSILTTVGVGGLSLLPDAASLDLGSRNILLNDPSECIGCDACLAGCKDYHQNYHEKKEGGAPPTFYLDVLGVDQEQILRRREVKTGNRTENARWGPEKEDAPYTGREFWLPIQCMHCEDSPCETACLGNAISTKPDGKVVIDHGSCIGCLSCVRACPFSQGEFQPIHYSVDKKKVYKCDMCHARIQDGKKEPACVEICPTEAKLYGEGNKMLEKAQTLAEERNGVVLYPGGTNVLFVLSEEQLNLLEQGNLLWEKYPGGRTRAKAVKYANYGFIPPVLGALAFVLSYRREKDEEIVKSSGRSGEKNE